MSAESHEFQPDEVMAYLDGEVTGERALALADHLEHCPDCASVADEICALSQQLVAWNLEPSLLKQPSLPVNVEAWCSEAAVDPTLNAEDPRSPSNQPLAAHPVRHSFSFGTFTLGPIVRRPWIWGFGSAFAVLLIVLSLSLRMGKVARYQAVAPIAKGPAKTITVQAEQAPVEAPASGGDALAKRIDNLPINSRNYISFTPLHSQAARDASPTIGPAPNGGARARGNRVSVDGADATDNSINGIRVSGFQTSVDTTREFLIAKSEMGTLIARNHDEIDQLRRLGERDYTEFTITGRNKPQRVANVTLELKGVNEKRNGFDLAITVEDKLFVKKNRTANEPIFFYTTGTHIPEEVVINKIGKDSVSGYVSVSVGKMIERTASLSLIVKNLEVGRTALEEITRNHDGYFAELSTSGQSNAVRTLTASVRVPSSQLDSTLAELRKIGEPDEEKQGGEEVSRQYVDLKARLENGRNTEKRLTELLAKRADRLKDVLDVERELASTREEIERMEAEQRNMQQLVNYASIELQLREEYKPALNLAPPGVGTRMRNATVDGYHSAVESALGLVLFLLQDGPRALLWLLLLFLPARWIWRKFRLAVVEKLSLVGTV